MYYCAIEMEGTVYFADTIYCIDSLIWKMGYMMADELTLLEANKRFLCAVNQHHPTEIANCFVADGQLMPTYCRIIHGREAIAAFWQGFFALEMMAMKRQTLEFQVCVEWAYETGSYELLGKENKVLDQGKYLVIWYYIEQTWKRYREIWNSSPPD